MRIMELARVSLMEKRLKTAVVREEESESGKTGAVPHVVIVGAGFGGLQAAKSLHNSPVQVTVIDLVGVDPNEHAARELRIS